MLRRLTSYASQHPLYQALRELGRIVRTTFLFQYMHEEEIRRRVNHQLTKVENMHQLAAELNLGKNGLIRYATKEDLLVMARSKQLLINSITCWNMLHISQRLQELSPAERDQLLASLPDTAPLSWKHINFQGEYDFSEGTLRNLVSLELEQLLKGESKQF
ncbi:Tn3 family transposase [Persicitalea sp.]|uniref:Tn3 family transposase n=1 Tax=Persicitalea sp. TaxID=3100273 RepID=UPI003593E510